MTNDRPKILKLYYLVTRFRQLKQMLKNIA